MSDDVMRIFICILFPLLVLILIMFTVRMFYIYKFIKLLHSRHPLAYEEYFPGLGEPKFWYTNNQGLLPFIFKWKHPEILKMDAELTDCYRKQFWAFVISMIIIIPIFIYGVVVLIQN